MVWVVESYGYGRCLLRNSGLLHLIEVSRTAGRNVMTDSVRLSKQVTTFHTSTQQFMATIGQMKEEAELLL